MLTLQDLVGKKVIQVRMINEGLPDEAIRIIFEKGLAIQINNLNTINIEILKKD